MQRRTHIRRSWVLSVFLCVAVLVLPAPVRATVAPPRSDSIYGMDILGAGWQWTFPRVDAWPRMSGVIRLDLLDSAFRQAAEAGVRYNRLAVWWCMVQPEREQWFWNDVDAAIQIGRNYGIETVPELMFTPYWAVAGAPYAPECINNDRRNVPPTDMADWENFIRTIVRRYGRPGQDAVHYWEIWNEPDLYEFLVVDNPSPLRTAAAYADLLNRAARIIRAESPGARVLLGGLSDINGPIWLDGLLSLSGKQSVHQSFDILSFHAYSLHTIRIGAARSVLEEHGLGERPIWDTELNNFGWDYDQARTGLARLYQEVIGAGVSRTFWYVGCTSGWGPGIFNPRQPEWNPIPFTPSPFYTTFKAQALPDRVPGQPMPLEPGPLTRKPRPTFIWQAATTGNYPIVGYSLQLDSTTFMGAPRFAQPGLSIWVSASRTSYLPLLIGGGHAGSAAVMPGYHAAPTFQLFTYTAERPLAAGQYYWRVAAMDAQGNVGPYSEVRTLQVRLPFDAYLPLVGRP